MGLNKDAWMKLMEEFFGSDNEISMEAFLGSFNKRPKQTGKLIKETVEFTKGQYKTTIDIYFDKTGVLMNMSSKSEYIPTAEEERDNQLKLLEQDKLDALEAEDYMRAADIQNQIKALVEAKTN